MPYNKEESGNRFFLLICLNHHRNHSADLILFLFMHKIFGANQRKAEWSLKFQMSNSFINKNCSEIYLF